MVRRASAALRLLSVVLVLLMTLLARLLSTSCSSSRSTLWQLRRGMTSAPSTTLVMYSLQLSARSSVMTLGMPRATHLWGEGGEEG